MKKTLLFLVCMALGQLSAQTLQSESFNALTIGNVGTDITGTTAGQGGWLTYSENGAAGTTSTNANNSNFQIVVSGFNSTNGLQFIGPNGNAGGRYMWKDGLGAAWASRTAGNNNIEVEFDFYTGAVTTSTSQVGLRIYGLDGSTYRTLAGFSYITNTRVLSGVAYLNNSGTLGTYSITLQSGGLVLNANTWYRIGVGYNTTNGQPYWKINSTSSTITLTNSAFYTGPFSPVEVDFLQVAPTTNSTTATLIFDNYIAKATATDNLLGNEAFSSEIGGTLAIYPNPVKDVLNVKTETMNFESFQIYDVKGRVVKDVIVNQNSSQLNVADLESGVYMIKIVTDQGSSTTKKFIKQ